MFVFLEMTTVMLIHRRSLAEFGGTDGVRDMNLVESALASAQNTAFYANGDAFDVAAAYAFHLAEAQAFLDGNKRTGIGAAIVFLAQNIAMGAVARTSLDALYAAMIAIARHELDKVGLAALLRRLFGG